MRKIGEFQIVKSCARHSRTKALQAFSSVKANNSEFVIWGTGAPIREWIYMLDVANIIKQIIDNKLFDTLPNPINLGQQHGTSIYETVQTVKQLLDYDVTIVQDTTKQDGAPIKILGNQQFKQYFPDFQFTDYETGIQNTINYYTGIL